jgi:hypothetical protein
VIAEVDGGARGLRAGAVRKILEAANRERGDGNGLRASGWEAISVDPVDLIRRLVDYQIETKLPPKFAKESDVVLAAITEGRRAIVVKISGVWDTRYVLLVPPRAGS